VGRVFIFKFPAPIFCFCFFFSNGSKLQNINTLMRIAGAMSCWILLVAADDASAGIAELFSGLSVCPTDNEVLIALVVVVVKGFIVVVVDVVVVVVVDVVWAVSLDKGPGLQITPAASDSSQSLMPQPSNRQSVKLFSPPTQ
jgi:hypothetical protein